MTLLKFGNWKKEIKDLSSQFKNIEKFKPSITYVPSKIHKGFEYVFTYTVENKTVSISQIGNFKKWYNQVLQEIEKLQQLKF